MTSLLKRVRRVTTNPTGKYVVILHPAEGAERPERIEIKEHGRRKGYSIEVGRLYTRLVSAAVEVERTGKRRRVKRGGLL